MLNRPSHPVSLDMENMENASSHVWLLLLSIMFLRLAHIVAGSPIPLMPDSHSVAWTHPIFLLVYSSVSGPLSCVHHLAPAANVLWGAQGSA